MAHVPAKGSIGYDRYFDRKPNDEKRRITAEEKQAKSGEVQRVKRDK